MLLLDDPVRTNTWNKRFPEKKEERAVSLLQPLGKTPTVPEREVSHDAECTMGDDILSFAGGLEMQSNCHRTISSLSPGDSSDNSREASQWRIRDQTGCQFGRMATSGILPHGTAIARAWVHGDPTRWAEDEEDEESKWMLSV